MLLAACARSDAPLYGGLDPDLPFVELSAGSALPQESAAAPEAVALADIDLAGCLRLALTHNRALRRSELQVERQRMERLAAWRSLIDPNLRADYQLEEGPDTASASLRADLHTFGFDVDPFIELDFDEDGSERYQSSYGVAVSRQLLRVHEPLRQRLPMNRAARAFLTALNQRLLELRSLRLRVTEGFYDIQRLKRRVAIRASRATDAEQFLEDVRVRVANGFAAPVEETNAAIQLNQAQADLLREETNLQNARERLLILLGQDLDSELSIREEAVPTKVLGADELPLATDSVLLLRQHERVRNQLLDMEILRQERQVSGDRLLPDLEGTLTWEREQSGDEAFDGGHEDRVSVGFSLGIPLDGYAVERARLRQDHLRLQQEALRLAEIRNELLQELRRIHRRIAQLQLTIDLARERVASERAKLDATIQRYEAGALDNLEVTRAKEELDRAELDLLEARIGRILEMARYNSLLPSERDGREAGGAE